VLIAKRKGKAIRFPEAKVRAMGRTAAGVRGVTLEDANDEVIGMVCVNPETDNSTILVVSERGYGKRTNLDDYRITGRGGKGVKTISITEKTGDLVGILTVKDEDGLMIICRSGMTIRTAVENLRIMGRATQGVRLINIKDGDSIAGVTRTPKSEDEEDQDGVEGVEGQVIEGQSDGTEFQAPESGTDLESNDEN
jgi:DNA gyrase subunit A